MCVCASFGDTQDYKRSVRAPGPMSTALVVPPVTSYSISLSFAIYDVSLREDTDSVCYRSLSIYIAVQSPFKVLRFSIVRIYVEHDVTTVCYRELSLQSDCITNRCAFNNASSRYVSSLLVPAIGLGLLSRVDCCFTLARQCTRPSPLPP